MSRRPARARPPAPSAPQPAPPRYQVVVYELLDDGAGHPRQRTVMDETGEGFVAVTGDLDGDRLIGAHSAAGPPHLLQHLADLAQPTPPG